MTVRADARLQNPGYTVGQHYSYGGTAEAVLFSGATMPKDRRISAALQRQDYEGRIHFRRAFRDAMIERCGCTFPEGH